MRLSDTVSQVILVGIGGSLGAALRYLVSNSSSLSNYPFPWSTAFVNVIGCFFIGIVIGAFSGESWFDNWGRSLIAIGFLGGLTTFSAFSYEILVMIEAGRHFVAGQYIGFSLVASFSATIVGFKLANHYIG
tara:strand:+ start:935 stop:1330 length:396 start_codon:yes stop_codon:yes gene_type:complete